jgi:mannose-6-phosphate isomerase class I
MLLLIPAGTIHTIGGGILLAELQQPTDCTLRLHDYGSERELHIDAALAAINPRARAQVWHPQSEPTQLRGKHLRLTVLSPGHHFLLPDPGEPHLLTALSGPSTIREVIGGRIFELAASELALALDGPLDLLVPSGSLMIDGQFAS